MGDKARRRREFLARHPVCCFCGGTTPATTTDHVPSRQLFDKRQWPEGNEFPACEPCNRATKDEEQVVAMLARIYPDALTQEGQHEAQQIMEAVGRNYPGVLIEMRLSARKVREFLKKRGIEKDPKLSTRDYPFLNVSGPLVNHCVAVFAIKLLCALHYKHMQAIVPLAGGVVFRWYSNIQALDGDIPDDLLPMLGSQPKLVRCTTTLNDQFSYRYATGPDMKASAFFVTFRESFAIAGFVREDATLFPNIDGMVVYPPRRLPPATPQP